MRILISLVTACAAFAPALSAQCSQWQPGLPFPGLEGTCTKVLTANPGMTGSRVFVAGSFHAVGGTPALNLASFDPATGSWSGVGGGVDGLIADMEVMPNGDLVVAGSITRAGGTTIPNNIAVWNGTTWAPLGQSGPFFAPGLSSIAVSPNPAGPRVVATGPFSGLAVYDGVAATLLTGSIGGSPISTLAGPDVDPGNVNRVVFGYIAVNGTRGVGQVLMNSVTWQSLRTVLGDGVSQVAFTPNGLYASGSFSTTITTPTGPVVTANILRNNGAWGLVGTAAANGTDGPVTGLQLLNSGALLVGGAFNTLAGVVTPGVGLLPNASVPATALGGIGGAAPTGTQLPNGNLFVGGTFETAGPAALPVANIATRDPGNGNWNVAAGFNRGLFTGVGGFSNNPAAPRVNALRTFGGVAVAGGIFSLANGLPASNLASWNGTAWTEVGGGCNGAVNALALATTGELIVGGNFTTVGAAAIPANGVAFWTGGSWRPLGLALTGNVLAVLASSNGDVVVGGNLAVGGAPTAVAVWNGTAWSIPAGGLLGTVRALAQLPNGDIVAGGAMPGLDNLWRLRGGTSWSAIGTPNDVVDALFARANGTIAIGGAFTTIAGLNANGVATYDGTSFGTLGAGLSASVLSFTETISGELLAGGSFAAPSQGVARFDGTSWLGVNRGVDRSVSALERVDDLTVVAGGDFTLAAGQVSMRFATLASTCLPSVTPYTLGTTGCGTMTAVNLPMVGTTFRADCTGLPTTSLVIAARGTTPSSPTPLTVPFPNLPTSCALLVDAVVLDNFVTTTGALQTSFPIPNIPANIGLVMSYQAIALEVDAQLNILSTAATNALDLTIGAF